MQFTARAFIGAVAIATLVLGTVFIVARTEAQRAGDASAARALEQSADLVAQLLAGRGRSLAGGARVFVQGPYFRTLVAERRRDDILDQTFEAAEQLDASWVFITDASGTLVAKSDEPSASGDQLASVALISGALRGQVMTGFGGSGDSALFQATAVPVAAPGGSPFGVLVATRLLDSAMAVDIATATGSELVFYVRTADGVAHVAASTLTRDSSLRESVRRRASGRSPMIVDGHEWITHATALNTAGGTEVGGYLVLRQTRADVPAIVALQRALAIASALGLLLAMAAAAMVHRSLVEPARRLAGKLRALAENPVRDRERDPVRDDTHNPIDALSREVSHLHASLQDQEILGRLLWIDATARLNAERAASETPPHAAGADVSRSLLPRRGRVERTLSLARSRYTDGDALPFSIGTVVAKRYRLDALLGQHDRDVFYRAFDHDRADIVVLSMVRPERLFLDPEARTRLAADVAQAAKVVHPHVAKVFDVGDADGVPFVTSEFVPGVSLARLLRHRGTLPVDTVSVLARQLLRALAAAHQHGVVHGGIQPHDIRLHTSRQVKLTGFGITHAIRDAAQREHTMQRAGDNTFSGRLAGATVGTPEYLAPEQLIGGPATSSSDMFALGVVLHECLAGHRSRGDAPVTLIGGRLRDEHDEAKQNDQSAWPPALAAMLISMTETDPARRAPSAVGLLETFDRTGALLE